MYNITNAAVDSILRHRGHIQGDNTVEGNFDNNNTNTGNNEMNTGYNEMNTGYNQMNSGNAGMYNNDAYSGLYRVDPRRPMMKPADIISNVRPARLTDKVRIAFFALALFCLGLALLFGYVGHDLYNTAVEVEESNRTSDDIQYVFIPAFDDYLDARVRELKTNAMNAWLCGGIFLAGSITLVVCAVIPVIRYNRVRKKGKLYSGIVMFNTLELLPGVGGQVKTSTSIHNVQVMATIDGRETTVMLPMPVGSYVGEYSRGRSVCFRLLGRGAVLSD